MENINMNFFNSFSCNLSFVLLISENFIIENLLNLKNIHPKNMTNFQFNVKILFLLNLIKLMTASINWSGINENCGISHSDRIIGGTTAALGQYPWIAHIGLLRNENGQFFLRLVNNYL